MNIYPENYQVEFDVLFTDLNGQPVTPTEITAILYDDEDQVIADYGAISFSPGDTHKVVVVPPAHNVLEDGQLQAARILRIAMVTAAGTIRRSSSWIIEGEFRLALMVNSFVTIEAAEIMARDMPNLSGWSTASEDKRYASLIEAFNRLTRIPMRFEVPHANDPTGTLYCPEETIIPASQWAGITEEQFLAFPADFRKAVRTAQLVEANEMIEGETMAQKHRQGIISETVGESSIMLRGGRVEQNVSSTTLRTLAGFIYFSHRIARA